MFGTWWLTKAAIPHLRDSDDGNIVNITSIAGLRPVGSSMAYAMSKAALNQMTLLLAKSYGPIRVNAVAPGLVATPWTSEWTDLHAGVARISPVGRVATPDDVAEATLALVRNRYVSGEIFVRRRRFHPGRLTDRDRHPTLARCPWWPYSAVRRPATIRSADMAKNEYHEYLKRVPLFRDLDGDELDAVGRRRHRPALQRRRGADPPGRPGPRDVHRHRPARSRSSATASTSPTSDRASFAGEMAVLARTAAQLDGHRQDRRRGAPHRRPLAAGAVRRRARRSP